MSTLEQALLAYHAAVAAKDATAQASSREQVEVITYTQVGRCAWHAAAPGGVIRDQDHRAEIAADAAAAKGKDCIDRFLAGTVVPARAAAYACQAGRNHVTDVLRRLGKEKEVIVEPRGTSHDADGHADETLEPARPGDPSDAGALVTFEQVAEALLPEMAALGEESDIEARRVNGLLSHVFTPASDEDIARRQGIGVGTVMQDRSRLRARMRAPEFLDQLHQRNPLVADYVARWLEGWSPPDREAGR